jgi:predicted alpha/beta hydrolase family esterase
MSTLQDVAPLPTAIVTVKRFDDPALQAAIERAMAQLSADKRGAFVAHADGSGASVSAVERIGSHVSIEGALLYPWRGKLEGEAELVASW